MDEPELKIIDVFICKLRKKLSLACGGAPQQCGAPFFARLGLESDSSDLNRLGIPNGGEF